MVKNVLERFSQPPRRVVSLIPSVTESLFDLGVGEAVVGVTDYCIHPHDLDPALPRLGGTKNPDQDHILDLQPDLVIANREENPRSLVEALQEKGIPVLVTFPKTVREALSLLYDLARIFQAPNAYLRLEILERSIEWAEADQQVQEKTPYFCPVWMSKNEGESQWWMTFNSDTYPHDLLALLGGANIFFDRTRSYPLEADLGRKEAEPPDERDTRFPRVTLDEIAARRPAYILLPDEPYGFDAADAEELQTLLRQEIGSQSVQVRLIDGSLLFWHGTRLGLALQQLGGLFAN